MAGRDITEGRPTRAIATDIGIVSDGAVWQNTDINYDVAIGGLPFIYAISDSRPYIRQTAPFRKDQFDNQTEPGEQSLGRGGAAKIIDTRCVGKRPTFNPTRNNE